jgi:glycosyltransferase involved in cell wall biosynthesis
MRVLFITWDGPSAKYLESLFLPIFKRLALHDIHFHVIQFNWSSSNELDYIRNICQKENIPYHSIKIIRNPISIGAFISAFFGTVTILKKIKEWKIDILMPRGILPGLSALLIYKFSKCKLVFDADGLPADERIDFLGASPSGFIYRFLRDIEAEVVRRSTFVITRSNYASQILQARAGSGTNLDKFFKVTNGRDSKIFRPLNQDEKIAVRTSIGIDPTNPLIIYVGSLGEKYRLDLMIIIFHRFYEINKNSKFLIVTSNTHTAFDQIIKSKIPSESFVILTARPDQVPLLIGASDLGLGIIEQTFSMKAASAIKIGEYLLCGIPVITSKEIGDNSSLPSDISFLVDDFNIDKIRNAADWFIDKSESELIKSKISARDFGLKNYSLDASVFEYTRAFSKIIRD